MDSGISGTPHTRRLLSFQCPHISIFFLAARAEEPQRQTEGCGVKWREQTQGPPASHALALMRTRSGPGRPHVAVQCHSCARSQNPRWRNSAFPGGQGCSPLPGQFRGVWHAAVDPIPGRSSHTVRTQFSPERPPHPPSPRDAPGVATMIGLFQQATPR